MGDHHYKGGHELEAINTGALFKLFFILTPVVLISSIVVIQWFYKQRNELILERAQEKSFLLADHDDEMAGELEGVDGVAKKVSKDASLLAANDPPAGWIHPDDVEQPGEAAPAEEPPAEDPAAAPEGEGAEDEGDAKPEDGDADGKKDDAGGEPAKDDAKGEDAKGEDDAEKEG